MDIFALKKGNVVQSVLFADQWPVSEEGVQIEALGSIHVRPRFGEILSKRELTQEVLNRVVATLLSGILTEGQERMLQEQVPEFYRWK